MPTREYLESLRAVGIKHIYPDGFLLFALIFHIPFQDKIFSIEPEFLCLWHVIFFQWLGQYSLTIVNSILLFYFSFSFILLTIKRFGVTLHNIEFRCEKCQDRIESSLIPPVAGQNVPKVPEVQLFHGVGGGMGSHFSIADLWIALLMVPPHRAISPSSELYFLVEERLRDFRCDNIK